MSRPPILRTAFVGIIVTGLLNGGFLLARGEVVAAVWVGLVGLICLGLIGGVYNAGIAHGEHAMLRRLLDRPDNAVRVEPEVQQDLTRYRIEDSGV